MTELLYQTDAYLQEFEAAILSVIEESRAVVLDKTAFYPGGGGQPCDLGSLLVNGVVYAVDKVKKQGDDFLHFLGGDVPSWGGSAGVCREAPTLASADGLHVKLLVPTLLFPVAEEVYRDFLGSVQAGLVVEQSHQGQLYRILRMYLDMHVDVQSFCRSGANPFRPREIVTRLREMTLGLQRRQGAALQPQE